MPCVQGVAKDFAIRVMVDHGTSDVAVAHGVHDSFQVSRLRQHEAAEVVARTVENRLAG